MERETLCLISELLDVVEARPWLSAGCPVSACFCPKTNMLATNHSCVPIRVESVALGPWLHHPLPQGPHRSICLLLWAPDSWLPAQWRRGNAGIRVRGKGLNLSLCSFLPMRPTFICKTRDADFSNFGGLCTWFNETVWRCLAHSRSFTKSPLTSAHDFVIVTLCDSGSWLINHSNRQKGKNPSDRPLGYHLSVFWPPLRYWRNISR